MRQQKALDGMELSYADMMKQAQAQPLERKIKLAIKLLQGYEAMALEHSADGYYLAFSGGKDSIVLKELAIMAGVKFKAFYNQTTIDPPELIYYMQEYHAEVLWNRAEKSLCFKMLDKTSGPPTRKSRWCCEIYKEQGGKGSIKLVGVRAAESPRRAAQWREVISSKEGATICPILYWADDDIWEFIALRRLPYCKLYDEGFKRLGCVGCPMGGVIGMQRDFTRWPGFERLWKKAFQLFWAKYGGTMNNKGRPRWFNKFGSWRAFWQWWISGGEAADNEECQLRIMYSAGNDESEVN